MCLNDCLKLVKMRLSKVVTPPPTVVKIVTIYTKVCSYITIITNVIISTTGKPREEMKVSKGSVKKTQGHSNMYI